jgi:hypothetical protein
MNLSVSPQVRIVALAALVAMLGLAVVVFTLGRRSSNPSSAAQSAQPEVVPHSQETPGLIPAPSQHATPAPAQPAVKPAVIKPRVSPAQKAALAEGWPRPLAKVIAANRVVVLEIYSSDAPLDEQAVAEARAGASQVGAAFYTVDVASEGTAATRAILRKADTLSAPATLILRRPGTVFVQLDGFQDQGSVAQAAANAALS